MKHAGAQTIATASMLTFLFAACASVPKIDGSSEASFKRTHAALVASLSPADQLRLQLAELVLLSPKGCIGIKPVRGLPSLSEQGGGQAVLLPCRAELNGLSFLDIMRLACPGSEPAKGGTAAPPNPSSKRTRVPPAA